MITLNSKLKRRIGLLVLSCLVLFAAACQQSSSSANDRASTEDWEQILEKAKGQTVYWHAWAGSPTINTFITWISEEVKKQYDIDLRHVKVQDPASTVSQVLAEKTAGKDTDGSVDLTWINGENFNNMKKNDLLFGPFAEQLPNFKYVDVENKPTTLLDFTVPTDGYESPWGMAQLNFIYDSARVNNPPRNFETLLAYAKANPGRVTYPAPPQFHGSTFLKQVLYETMSNPGILQKPVVEADFRSNIQPLVDYLDDIQPHLWQGGVNYPKDSTAMERLLADNEIDFAVSFNPGHASEAINSGRLPASVRTLVMEDGMIGNTHFVAIPYNSGVTEAARVVANFLMSPQAQARKADPELWGDPTVLGMHLLEPAQKKLFDDLPLGPATLTAAELGKVLPEPHPSWMERVEKFWVERYKS